jgi:hypothetical protein
LGGYLAALGVPEAAVLTWSDPADGHPYSDEHEPPEKRFKTILNTGQLGKKNLHSEIIFFAKIKTFLGE